MVKFINRRDRDKFLVKAKKAKLTGTVIGQGDHPVYVDAHLTQYYKKLMFETKKVAREKGYKFVWFRNEQIRVKKDETVKRYTVVQSIEDIKKIV